jgi:hypothetical protein
MTTADPTTPPRRRRLLRWLLLGWLAWLVGANALLLSGQAERWANRRPERVQIHVGRTWTILPLLIHLREVTVDGQTRQRSYRVSVERAAGLWFLPTMAAKRIDVPILLADGVAAAFSRGGHDLPVSTKRPWRFWSGWAEADRIRRLAIDRVAFEPGSAAARGRVSTVARGPVALTGLRLRAAEARISLDGENIARGIDLEARGQIGPYVPSQHRGVAIMPFVSGSVDLAGAEASLAILKHHLAPRPWLGFHGGEAKVEAHLEIVRGELQAGSRLTAVAEAVGVDVFEWRLTGPIELELTVDAEGREQVDAELARVIVERPGVDRVIAEGERVHLALALDDAALVRSHPSGTATLDMPRATIPDLAVFSDLLPGKASMSIDGGSAELAMRLEVQGPELAAHGRIAIAAHQAALTVRERALRADLTLELLLAATREDLRAGIFELGGSSLLIDHAGLDAQAAKLGHSWRARLGVDRGTLELRRRTLHASAEIQAQDLRPLLALAFEKERSIDRAERWLKLSDLHGWGSVVFQPRRLALRHLALVSGKASMSAEMCFAAERRLLMHGSWGKLDLGVDKRNRASTYKLVKVEPWFQQLQDQFECR